MSTVGRLKIGFIPLVDATTLFIAVDMGFTKDEGLDVELVREVYPGQIFEIGWQLAITTGRTCWRLWRWRHRSA